MAGEDLFQNQRAPWLTLDKTAAASITTPPDAGDIRIFLDSDDGIFKLKDESGNVYPLAAGNNNLTATTAPTTGDDTNDGYTIGSLWVDVTGDEAYIAVDVSAGAAVWAQISVSAADHKLDDHAAPDDNTDLDASASAHGLLPKLSGTATQFLDGSGAWDTPDHGELGGLADDDHPQYVKDSEFTGDDIALLGTGSGTFAAWKHNFAATTAPTGTDDSSAGYGVGSIWIDVTGDAVYICYDATASNALWQSVGAGDMTTDDGWAAKGDLIVGTGANTAQILTVGTNDYVLTADSAQATGLKWAAGGGGGGASAMDDLTDADTTTVTPEVGDALQWDGTNWVPSVGLGIVGNGELGTYEDFLAAPVSVSSSSTWYDAASVTLPAGKYVVFGRVAFTTTGAADCTVRLSDDASAHWAEGSHTLAANTYNDVIPVFAVIDLAAETTVKLQGRSNGTTTTIEAAVNNGSSGNYATNVTAVRLEAATQGASALPSDKSQKTDGAITGITSTTYADTDSATDLTVVAEAGDVLLIGASGRWVNGSGTEYGFLDAVTLVASSPVNYVSGAGSSGEGVQAWATLEDSKEAFGGAVAYTVVSGDIENGTVTLRMRHRAGASTNIDLQASTTQPLDFWAVNLRAVGAPRATVGDGAPSNPAVGQLWYDSDATPSGAGGTGTTFPTSPTTGDTYRRSDIDYTEWFYDGTYWLSRERFIAQWLADDNVTASGYGSQMFFPTTYDVYIERIDATARATGGSGNWDIEVRKMDSSGTYTIVGSAVAGLAPDSGGTVTATGSVTPDALISMTTEPYILRPYFTENSGTATVSVGCAVYYRLRTT